MKSTRYLFTLLLLSTAIRLQAQYDSIFKIPFPEQMRILDSVCMKVAESDSSTFYKELEKIKFSATNVDEYTQLNLDRAILSVKTDNGYERESVVSNGEKIIERATKLNAPEIAAVQYMTLGFFYELQMQSFDKAFENYLKAYDMLDKIPIEKLPPRQYAQYRVSLTYYHYNDYENALRLSLRTDKSFREKTKVYVLNADLIGMCYLKTGRYDSARVYFNHILEYAHVTFSEPAWKGIALGNIGSSYFLENNFEKAIPFLLQAVPLTIEGNVYDNTVGFAAKLSAIFLKKNNPDGAKKFLDITLSAAHKAGDDENYFTAYNAAASYYRIVNNASLALLYVDSASLSNNKLAAKRDLNAKYKVEMAVLDEQVKERENLFAQEKQGQLVLRNTIIVFVLLVMVITLLLYNRAQLKNRNRQQQLLAEKQLAENELQSASQQLNAFTQSMRDKNELIEKAKEEIERMNAELLLAKNQIPGTTVKRAEDNHSLQLLQNSVLLTDEAWKDFTILFEKVHSGFFQRLKEKIPGLSPAETRFTTLTRLQLSNKEMANMLGVGTDAIRQIRSRLKKKLNLGAEEGIEEMVERI